MERIKAVLATLILSFSSLVILAQSGTGIAVQGIARDAEKAALGDELLPFKFEIVDADGYPYYTETMQIKTDPYGVFSHIIGTGSPADGNKFSEIPFRKTHMRLVITATYDGTTLTLSDAPFQYTPYALSAENGVPTGTIVAFAGSEGDIPAGWILCDGRALSTVPNSSNLSDLIGANAPDLRGMFLRGTGSTPTNSHTGPKLGEVQEDGLESHSHGKGTLDVPANSGSHYHDFYLGQDRADGTGDDEPELRYGDDATDGYAHIEINSGAHDHQIVGETGSVGISETRPVNYGVNYIIKL